MKKNTLLKITILSTLIFSVSSCALFSGIADAGADLAQAAGVIDKETADAISHSAHSIEKAAEVITPEQEYYIGRAVAANIVGKYRLDSNQKIEAYLNKICKTIVINSEQPDLFKGYYVALLKTRKINAFSTPGGHILVSRGLLRCANSEDALAAVIAHEIAHIQLQHSIKAIKSGRTVEAIFATADSAVKISSKGNMREITNSFSEGVDDIVSQMVEKGYSKNQEYAADKLALKLMYDAGYNPYAMLDMLKLLEKHTDQGNTGFGKTHPSAHKRYKKVKFALRIYPKEKDEQGQKKRQERFDKIF